MQRDGPTLDAIHPAGEHSRGDRYIIGHADIQHLGFTVAIFEQDGRCGLRTAPARGTTVNYMVQYASADLDASFAALSDATRRGVLERLGRDEASITDLAGRFHMTLTGVRKHVDVLERAGLVVTEKVGRVRTCRIGARRLEDVAEWIEGYHRLWDGRFAGLDQVIEELKQKEKSDGHDNTR